MRKLSFSNPNYPDEDQPILKYLNGFFDSAFVAFCPFIAVAEDREYRETARSFQGSVEMSQDKLRKDKLIGHLADRSNLKVFGANEEYPEDVDVLNKSTIVPWKDVQKLGRFSSFSSIQIALQTTIGALNPRHDNKRLAQRLSDFCAKRRVWQPIEGYFSPLIRKEIVRWFDANGYDEIVLYDELEGERKIIHTKGIDVKAFLLNQFLPKFKCCHSIDEKLMFTIHWDSFFFLICSSRQLICDSLRDSWIEGFYCRDNTRHAWYLS